MERFIDAHCHYNPAAFGAYDGACEFICNATVEDDWGPIIAAAAADARIHPAIGIHPWYQRHTIPGWADRMRRILRENPNLMVGEIGIDKTRPCINRQCRIFQVQYKIASELQRTVHIHCVHSWDKMLHIMKRFPLPPAIVMHRYSASEEMLVSLRRAFDDRVYFSYRNINSNRLRKILMATPATRILVETDDWMPRPDKIQELVTEIAIVRGRKMSYVRDRIYNNTMRVIGNGQIE